MTRASGGGVLDAGEVMGVKLIAYSCDAPEHQPGSMAPDKLTIYLGDWAFCESDARADGHHWTKTGGASLDDLMRHARLTIASPVAAKP